MRTGIELNGFSLDSFLEWPFLGTGSVNVRVHTRGGVI